jgi:Short C-terminal domain
MVLLSQLIRRAAITGRTDTINASWFAGRQGGRWAEQTVRSAMPTAAPPTRSTAPASRDPAETLRELTELHQRGVLTQAEFEDLRTRLGV